MTDDGPPQRTWSMSHRPPKSVDDVTSTTFGLAWGAGEEPAGGQNRGVGDVELVTRLRQAGVGRGDLVGLAVSPDGTVAVAADAVAAGWVGSAGELGVADDEVRPRWVTWSQEDAQRLIAQGVRLATCWD